MDYEKARTYTIDVEELACKILGINYDDVDSSDIEQSLYEEFEIDFEAFQNIVSRLLPLIDVGESPLTKKRYKGFSNQMGSWYTKIEIKS